MFKELWNRWHEIGIKVPFLRDPIKKEPSVSLTMLFVSFNLYIFTLINKLANWFSDIDGASQLLLISAGLYFGRSFTSKIGTSKKDTKEDKNGTI